ncbi:hypothetical protein C7999DRAFT_28475 [Corynascus novoguineensis]|uniref:Uncharacterized protein n=1 Tax=Corynascus novoguineensis TaxID=1126955 RepID=A0AAN7CYU6_9PEZI|nr:hypothetical protein C7999DRAFT_28475 [Corynascus novoguineensis]
MMGSRRPNLPCSLHATRQAVFAGPIERGNENDNSDDGNSSQKRNKYYRVAEPSNPATAGVDSPGTGRPRDSINFGGGKYGRCPRCATGRRVRSRFNPYGHSAYRGKFRFVCSNKTEHGCGYSEVLESDPALDPGSFMEGAATLPRSPAPALTAYQHRIHGQSWTRASGGDCNDGMNLGMGGSGLGRGIVVRRDGNMEEEEEEEEEDEKEFESVRQAPLNTPPEATSKRTNNKRNAGRDTPQQRLGCPQCMQGRLTKRFKNISSSTEAVLVCADVWDGKEMVGGCGYKIEIETEPVKDEDKDVVSSTGAAINQDKGESVVNARTQIQQLKRKSVRQLAHERKEKEKFIVEQRARAMADPNAAALMVAPTFKTEKKVVVDLTRDDELHHIRPELIGEAVGPYAPILIPSSDDEAGPPAKRIKRKIRTAERTEPAQRPQNMASEDFDAVDDLELAQLAEQVDRVGHKTIKNITSQGKGGG